jgi:hypothetical protein
MIFTLPFYYPTSYLVALAFTGVAKVGLNPCPKSVILIGSPLPYLL